MGETSGQQDQALVCRIHDRSCALPLRVVGEVMRPLPVEPLPGAPPSVLGVAVIRGLPTPVVDGGALLGAPTTPARFVTLRVGDRRVALAVDGVLGIGILPAGVELPPLLRDAARHAIAAIGVLDRELVLVLETMRLLPPETA